MRAIILAAGRGSRMKDLTESRPKCLVKVNSREETTLLDLQISSLIRAGIRDIAIVTGYKRELLADMFETEFYNSRWNETNMVSSLLCANQWLAEEECIVSYSDIFYEPSAVEILIEGNKDIEMVFDPNWQDLWERRFGSALIDSETFQINNLGFLTDIGREPKSLDQIHGQYMGLLKFTPNGWNFFKNLCDSIPSKDLDKLDMTSALRKIIQQNFTNVYAHPYCGLWGEVDSQTDLIAYRNLGII